MTPAPTFGPAKGQWSIGSRVQAFYWTSKRDEFRMLTFAERLIKGRVSRIHAGGPEGWRITIDPEVPFDGSQPEYFNPSQITAIKRTCNR